jgi:hypothetical protein
MSGDIILIGTHQARLRGFLHELLYAYRNPDENIDTNAGKINAIFAENGGAALGRFMNCAVVKLEVGYNNITISLVYQGELDPTEGGVSRVYYIDQYHTTEGTTNRIVFPTITIPTPEGILPLGGKTIYIMRHGQAEHNPRKYSKSIQSLVGFRNTSLTEIGVKQAENAADKIGNEINNISLITFLFASDLKRTRETVAVVYSKLFERGAITKSEDTTKTIYILPCSHEVQTYSPKGSNPYNIDKANKGAVVGTENTPTCTFSPIIEKDDKSTIKFIADSSYYNDFYNAKCRVSRISRFSSLFGRSSRKHCSTTNMLIEAALIIQTEEKKDTKNMYSSGSDSSGSRQNSDNSDSQTNEKNATKNRYRLESVSSESASAGSPQESPRQGGKKTGKMRQMYRKTRKIKLGGNIIKSRSMRNDRRKRHSRK